MEIGGMTMPAATDTTFDPAAGLRSFLASSGAGAILDTIQGLRGLYVSTDRDKAVQAEITRLIANAAARWDVGKPYGIGNRTAGVGFALIGNTGSGKSTALLRAFRKHPAFPGYGIYGGKCILLTVTAPSPCTLGQIALEILEKLGYVPDRELKENRAWRLARFHLRVNGILFLHIEDAQHILHVSDDETKQRLCDTLKNLMIDDAWPIQLILSGIPDLKLLLESDKQVRRRFKYANFGKISIDDHADLIDGRMREYAAKAKLKVAIDPEDEVARRLAHGAFYELGLIFEILIDAIECAVGAGKSSLSLDDFADAYASRTLEPTELNVFVARDWDKIDTAQLQVDTEQRLVKQIRAKESGR
jgi:hypothetical protein